MEGDFIKINNRLTPLSWIYGGVVRLRNFCFDVGLLKSRAFRVPVIAVGNITVGGTGKTPHVEYLVRLLHRYFHVAVLSRGYKRKTNGYLLAGESTTVSDIGDEPYQMKMKFKDISVAVDKKRTRGIDMLTANDESINVILLDDAFQHRYVKPGINILLVDYHRLIIHDKMLPAGRLREPLKGKDRADIVIITKCPKSLKPMEFRVITRSMNLFPYQQLFFTTLKYDTPKAVYRDEELPLSGISSNDHIMMIAGIASPRQMEEDIRGMCNARLKVLTFADHHNFSRKDIEHINSEFKAMSSPKHIITTEKDATRIRATEGLSDEVKRHLYVLPVSIAFMQQDQEEKFNDTIIGYVRKNSKNSILVMDKEQPKTQAPDNNNDNKPKRISFKNF